MFVHPFSRKSLIDADIILIAEIATIVSRTCLIGADLILFCITWWSLKAGGKSTSLLGKNTFTNILMRDGKIHPLRSHAYIRLTCRDRPLGNIYFA